MSAVSEASDPETPDTGSQAVQSFIDTHVHVACPDNTRYPTRPTGVGSTWWRDPDGHSDAVFASARRAGASRVVVVQAVGAYGYDSTCAAAAVAGSDGFASLVTAIDMSTPDLTAALEPCAGWRLFGVADDAPWLGDGRADEVWQRAAELDVVIVPTVFTDRLEGLSAIVERHPDVAVALDHCAFPDMGGAEGEQALFALADLTMIRLKVSTHVLAAWQEQGRLDETFERLVSAFGTDRMCWGSDHPQHQGLTYDDKIGLARHATRNLGQRGHAEFFTGTATGLGWG
jgi:L-fuconolactonase